MKFNFKKNKAFTLLEMMIVVAIFAVLSALLIFNYSSFKSSISLNNLSDDIALTIRKAQVYAISVKSAEIATASGAYFPGYGIHFSTTTMPANGSEASEKKFVFFADILNPSTPGLPSNKAYDSYNGICDPNFISYQNECMDVVSITSQDKISDFCLDGTCNQASNISSLDIVFMRPDSDAYFCVRSGAGANCSNPNANSTSNYSNVSIILKSIISNKTKTITVYNTGQISVQ